MGAIFRSKSNQRAISCGRSVHPSLSSNFHPDLGARLLPSTTRDVNLRTKIVPSLSEGGALVFRLPPAMRPPHWVIISLTRYIRTNCDPGDKHGAQTIITWYISPHPSTVIKPAHFPSTKAISDRITSKVMGGIPPSVKARGH